MRMCFSSEVLPRQTGADSSCRLKAHMKRLRAATETQEITPCIQRGPSFHIAASAGAAAHKAVATQEQVLKAVQEQQAAMERKAGLLQPQPSVQAPPTKKRTFLVGRCSVPFLSTRTRCRLRARLRRHFSLLQLQADCLSRTPGHCTL